MLGESQSQDKKAIKWTYRTIEWTYRKGGSGVSDKSKNKLRQMGMSRDGISQLTSANTVSSQKDMQIVAMLVSKALG